jgi:hypothetical protein
MKRKKPAQASGSGSFDKPEIGQIEELLRFMSEHNLEEFEYARGDLRIRLKKPSTHVVAATAPAPAGRLLCLRQWPRTAGMLHKPGRQ